MNISLPTKTPVSSSRNPSTPWTSTQSPGSISLPTKSAFPILRNLDHTLSLNERKMAVVNLEAALASHKSINNHNIYQVSQMYRNQLSASLRISPSRMGGMPHGLMSHWLNSER